MTLSSQRYDQLIEDLRSEYRPQRVWIEGRGFFLVVGHFLVGIAAGTWLLARYYGSDEALVAAFVIGGLGGLAHLVNLARPGRFLKMLARVRTSWVSRGFWGLALLFLGGVLYLPPRLLAAWPWGVDSLLARTGDAISLVGAVIIVGYMGFVYKEVEGNPVLEFEASSGPLYHVFGPKWRRGASPLRGLAGTRAASGPLGNLDGRDRRRGRSLGYRSALDIQWRRRCRQTVGARSVGRTLGALLLRRDSRHRHRPAEPADRRNGGWLVVDFRGSRRLGIGDRRLLHQVFDSQGGRPSAGPGESQRPAKSVVIR